MSGWSSKQSPTKEILSSGWPCSPRSFLSPHCRLPSSMLQVRSFKLHSRTKFYLEKSSGKESACFVTRGLECRGRPSLDKTLTAWSQSESKSIWIHIFTSCLGSIGSVWRRSGLKKALKTVTLLPDKPEAIPCEIQKETFNTLWNVTEGGFISQIWRQERECVFNFIMRLQRGDIGQIGRWSLSTSKGSTFSCWSFPFARFETCNLQLHTRPSPSLYGYRTAII